MIQRAEMIEIFSNNKDGTGEGGDGGGGGARRQRKHGDGSALSSGIVCSACYGQRFRTTDEATVRTAIWTGSSPSFGGGGYPSSSRMFDTKKSNTPQRGGNDGESRVPGPEGGDNAERKWSKRATDDQKLGSRSRSVQGISTSSLFDMPKEGHNAKNMSDWSPPKSPIDAEPSKTPSNPNSISSRIKSPSDYRRQRSSPPRRTSSILGGGKELVNRMQRDSDSRDTDDLVEEQILTERTLEARRIEKSNTSKIRRSNDGASRRRAIAGGNHKGKTSEQRDVIHDSSIHSPNDDDGVSILLETGNDDDEEQTMKSNDNIDRCWVKVDDPVSKQTLYWNTQTGEMKRSLKS
ncbi:hypothetical protein ACHAW5_007060 [Stephanodiscus triporus]|uniref:Uncharacterized protein n=1 Tax=Stephanodiscus triporus TaxID=2934178 RepID=A0ABD3QFA7_9STRA